MEISAILGWTSMIAWTFAEIPQIITNYEQKSASGIHLCFLLAWCIGDIFNVSGCIMEPATLPTQLYMAMVRSRILFSSSSSSSSHLLFTWLLIPECLSLKLYTIGTCVLLGQKLYYDYIFPKRESHINEPLIQSSEIDPELGGDGDPTIPILIDSKDLYYMSARSLAVSPNPTSSSLFPCSVNFGQNYRNGDDLNSTTDRLTDDNASTTSNKKITIKGYVPKISLLLSASVGLCYTTGTDHSSHGFVILPRRMLLDEGSSSMVGTILGWAMAICYISGRLPQICLNNSNDTRTGVNPSMFTLALFANTTYIASILFKSLEWSNVFPNLPWVVDAGACVLLDLFILIQLYILS